MKFLLAHNNINVFDLEKSIGFYKEALGLTELKRHKSGDGSFVIVFMGDGSSKHLLELTWLKDKKEPYNLGDNESHIAFTADDFDAAYKHHQKMGCISFENKSMGLYFIEDPDGYWVEILPVR